MNTKLETLLDYIPYEGNSLKYTFDNSYNEVTLQMLASKLSQDESEDHSLYLLRVVGFGGIEGEVTVTNSIEEVRKTSSFCTFYLTSSVCPVILKLENIIGG